MAKAIKKDIRLISATDMAEGVLAELTKPHTCETCAIRGLPDASHWCSTCNSVDGLNDFWEDENDSNSYFNKE